jgi:hypothetical protein
MMSMILERLLGFATRQLHAANLFALKELRNLHTHIMNPNAGLIESN